MIGSTNIGSWAQKGGLEKTLLQFNEIQQKLLTGYFNEKRVQVEKREGMRCLSSKVLRRVALSVRRVCREIRTAGDMMQIQEMSVSEQTKVKLIAEYQIKQSKLTLINLIKDHIQTEKANKQTCLICESKLPSTKMQFHLTLCKRLYSSIQKIDQVNSELEAKIHDLNSLYVSTRKVNLQKKKRLSFDGTQSTKPTPKFNKNFSKSLKVPRNRSQLLIDFERKPSEEFEEELFLYKSNESLMIEEMEACEIERYLEIVEDTRIIALKVKNSKREMINLSIYIEIKQFKAEIFEKFDTMPSEEILDTICVIKKKLKLVYEIRELETKISKQVGHKKSFEFQGEYEDLESLKSESIIYETMSNSVHSDDERSSTSLGYQVNEIRLKDFKIIKLLSQGKFGEVYLVKKIKTGVKYAMKRIPLKNKRNENELQNLINQNNTFSIINNDFLVKAIFSFTEGKYHYFVMEYAPHGDFAKRLMIEQRLYEYEARSLLAEIAVAINSLHQHGIIHRDIKPHNIVIDSLGHLKLTDYGLSQTNQLKKKKLQTRTRTYSKFIYEEVVKKSIRTCKSIKTEKIVGSPYYMSPEVLEFRPISKMSDWWSFGILVYQTLVGQPPFIGEDMDEIASKIIEGNIWWTSEIAFGDEQNMISYEAKDLIDLLLTKDEGKRLGQSFEDIKAHSFFNGVDWDNLRQIQSPFEAPEEDFEIEEKFHCEVAKEQFSLCGSTAPELKLIRRDILGRETRVNYYKHLGNTLRLEKILKQLEDEIAN